MDYVENDFIRDCRRALDQAVQRVSESEKGSAEWYKWRHLEACYKADLERGINLARRLANGIRKDPVAFIDKALHQVYKDVETVFEHDALAVDSYAELLCDLDRVSRTLQRLRDASAAAPASTIPLADTPASADNGPCTPSSADEGFNPTTRR